MIWWASQGKYNDGIQYFFSCCTRTWRSCRTSASMTRLGSSLDSRNRWSTCTTRWVCNKDAEPTEANFFFCSSWSWSFIARPKPSFFFCWSRSRTIAARLKPTPFLPNFCFPAETDPFLVGAGVKVLLRFLLLVFIYKKFHVNVFSLTFFKF